MTVATARIRACGPTGVPHSMLGSASNVDTPLRSVHENMTIVFLVTTADKTDSH